MSSMFCSPFFRTFRCLYRPLSYVAQITNSFLRDDSISPSLNELLHSCAIVLFGCEFILFTVEHNSSSITNSMLLSRWATSASTIFKWCWSPHKYYSKLLHRRSTSLSSTDNPVHCILTDLLKPKRLISGTLMQVIKQKQNWWRCNFEIWILLLKVKLSTLWI